MDHNLNQGGADKETTLGFDNADILAEKRRRDAAAAAKSTPAVSANTLRAQMQAGNTKAPSGGPQRPASGAVPARPQTAAAQPAARPAHGASGTVHPVSSAPRQTAPKAPSQSKVTGAANTRPSAPVAAAGEPGADPGGAHPRRPGGCTAGIVGRKVRCQRKVRPRPVENRQKNRSQGKRAAAGSEIHGETGKIPR